MSLLAMNGLYKGHVIAKQNSSSRQSRCVATSNKHVLFLALFVTCYKCFVARKVGSVWRGVATGKVKTFPDTVLGLPVTASGNGGRVPFASRFLVTFSDIRM